MDYNHHKIAGYYADLLTKDYNFDHKFTLLMQNNGGMVSSYSNSFYSIFLLHDKTLTETPP